MQELSKEETYSSKQQFQIMILHKHYQISSFLIEFGAQSYYGETEEQKDFSPIFLAV